MKEFRFQLLDILRSIDDVEIGQTQRWRNQIDQ